MAAIPLTVLPMPGFPPTVKPISIPDSWRFSGRKGLKSDTKTNTCWIREVSAICVYGLHHSAIYGIMQPVRGFVWPFVVWLHIVRFREMQRFVLCTEYRIMPPKTARNEKSPVSRSIRSTGLSYILIAFAPLFSCHALCKAVLPASVKELEGQAFSWCENLAQVFLHEGLSSIGYSAFYFCTALRSITIPKSVTAIGEDVFYRCHSDFTVSCYAGSFALEYARKHGFQTQNAAKQ